MKSSRGPGMSPLIVRSHTSTFQQEIEHHRPSHSNYTYPQTHSGKICDSGLVWYSERVGGAYWKRFGFTQSGQPQMRDKCLPARIAFGRFPSSPRVSCPEILCAGTCFPATTTLPFPLRFLAASQCNTRLLYGARTFRRIVGPVFPAKKPWTMKDCGSFSLDMSLQFGRSHVV